MRVSLGFEPRWFHSRCGVDFSERWHRDPVYRYATLVRMRNELRRVFPSVSYWDDVTDAKLATLSGCYGVCVIPRVFGLPVRYYPDRWPHLELGHRLSNEQIRRIDADRLLAGGFVKDLFRQMETIASRWGTIYGYLNWQGVLNNAYHLRGQQIFVDLVDQPGLAGRLFTVVTEVMIRLARLVHDRQARSGFVVDHFSVSNCMMNLISPQMYRRFLFEHDQRIAEAFARFGVHTCNWDITPYLDELRNLPKVGYVDMGLASDLVRAKRAFPEARRAVLYSPERLARGSLPEVRRDLERVGRELSPCDIVMADIAWDTPDGRVDEFIQMCAELEGG